MKREAALLYGTVVLDDGVKRGVWFRVEEGVGRKGVLLSFSIPIDENKNNNIELSIELDPTSWYEFGELPFDGVFREIRELGKQHAEAKRQEEKASATPPEGNPQENLDI